MAEFVFESVIFNAPFGKKVDMDSLSSKCRAAMPFAYLRKEEGESSKIDGDTNMAEKIRLMDSVPPTEYLSFRQTGRKPAKPNLRLVEKLSMEIGLSDPCINALIDYVLYVNDNVLAAALCEKMAASLVREGCRSAKDAMDYLLRRHRKGKQQNTKRVMPPYTKKEPTKPVTSEPRDEEEEVSDEEVKRLLDELYKDKKK